MTLAEYFMNPTPLDGYVLVFSEALRDILITIQNDHPSQFRVDPFKLTDGRYILHADILSEVGELGIYRENFQRLPSEQFSQVLFLTFNEIAHLVPQETE